MASQATGRPETILEVPIKLVKECGGFSLDFGGSVVKLTYRNKTDWEETNKAKNPQSGKLRLVCFSRQEWTKVLEHIEKYCFISREGEELTKIYGTGIGCYQYDKQMQQTLKIKIEVLSETDCFVKALGYLSRYLSHDELVHKHSEEARQLMELRVEETLRMINKFATLSEKGMTNQPISDVSHLSKEQFLPELVRAYSQEPLGNTKPYIFPALLCMMGSAVGFMEVTEGGIQGKISDYSIRGGRMFLGMGSLLTGAKTYEELIELASKGNLKNIDTFPADFVPDDKAAESGDEEKNLYSEGLEDTFDDTIFCFGKAVGKNLDSFRREDLAASLLNVVATDIANSAYSLACSIGAKHVFFAGGFGNTEIARRLISAEFAKKRIMMESMKSVQSDIEFHFLKNGGHMGSIGAMINQVEPFLQSGADAQKAEVTVQESV